MNFFMPPNGQRSMLLDHLFVVIAALTIASCGFQFNFLIIGLAIYSFLFYAIKFLANLRNQDTRNALKPRFLAVLIVFAGSLLSCQVQTKRLEGRMAPVILALSAYHDEIGNYPDKLEDLVPKHLAAIPSCPFHPLLYFPRLDRDRQRFSIGCVTVGFNKHEYDSITQSWADWD